MNGIVAPIPDPQETADLQGQNCKGPRSSPFGDHNSLCLCAPYELLNDLGLLFRVDLAISRLEPIPRKLGFATRALPTAKTRPGSGVGSPTLARRPGRPASVLVALALAFLRSRLDPRHAGGRGEEGRVTVVPTDSQAWRLFLEHLFDHAPAPGLADPLRLDHDHVSRVRPHAQPHLLPQLEAGL